MYVRGGENSLLTFFYTCVGSVLWSHLTVACPIQLCDAPTCLLQYGLLLAAPETTSTIQGKGIDEVISHS